MIDIILRAGVELLEAWEDLMAEERSGVGGVLVGGVCRVGQVVLERISKGLVAGGGEQGSKKVVLGGGHAADPPGSGATGEIKEDRLGLVGGGVACGDEMCSVAFGQGAQRLVARCSGLGHAVALFGDLNGDPFKGNMVRVC